MKGPRTAMKSGPRLPQLERKPSHRNENPTQPKINKLINKLKKKRITFKKKKRKRKEGRQKQGSQGRRCDDRRGALSEPERD